MAEFKVSFLKPDYYDKFQCIGGDCRHNCCSYNWRIDIDKKTYKRYRQVTKPIELAQRLKKHIKMIDIDQTTKAYARIEHLKNPIRCPFEMANGLCMIQKELGAEWLSATCKKFPRGLNVFQEKPGSPINVEQAEVSGCEVIVSYFLHHKEEMQFIVEEKEMSHKEMTEMLSSRSGGLVGEKVGVLFENYYEIKSVAIAILQNRELSFENRLILLGLFSQKLDEWRELEGAVTYQKIQEFVASIDEKSFAEAFADTKPDYNRQFLVVNNLYQLIKSSNGEIFQYIDQKTIENHTAMKADPSDIDALAQCYKRYLGNYQTYMKDKEHFIENLLVNEFHHLTFPFVKPTSAYDSYRYIVLLFLFYRYMVCYYMGTQKEITEEELIDITVYWGRGVANGVSNVSDKLSVLDTYECKSLAEMALLIK